MFLHKNFNESIEKQIYEISYFLKDIKVLSAYIFNNILIQILFKYYIKKIINYIYLFDFYFIINK